MTISKYKLFLYRVLKVKMNVRLFFQANTSITSISIAITTSNLLKLNFQPVISFISFYLATTITTAYDSCQLSCAK